MNLMDETLQGLKNRGNSPAIINQQGHVLSFGEFYDFTTKLSFLLQSRGIKKDSKIVILSSLDWPLYTAIAACFQLGAIVVLIDPWANSKYIKDALSQVEPDFLLISKKARLFYLKGSIRRIRNKILLDELIQDPTPGRLFVTTPVDKEQTALITFTSGSTGKPKGFDRSHLFLLSQQLAHQTYFDHEKEETDLTMYPVFVLSNLKSGLTSVLIKGNLRKIDKLKPENVYTQISQHKVDSLSISPAILDKLISYCELHDLPLPLKKVFTGGAPVRIDLCERLLKLNPSIKGQIVYGSTEVEPIALVSMDEVLKRNHDVKGGTPLGRIVPALSYRLLPISGSIHSYHKGIVGEVCLTGDFVGKKYWKNEAAFHENKYADEEGRIWHKTGDIVIEKDGFLSLIGRRNNFLETTEGRLYPLPVENQLDQIEGVKKSAYIQLQSKNFLIYEGKESSKNLIADFFRKENLPINEIRLIKSIPMDPRHRSKIDSLALKEVLTQGQKMRVTHDSPLAQRLLAYTKERFPLIPISLFVFLLTSGYAHFMANWFKESFQWGESGLWITMVCVFLFMLQLRMADEIKDFEKDSRAFPERLLSRGIVSLGLIRNILYMTILCEVALSLWLGLPHFCLMVILQIWAFLMFKEFFSKKILDQKHTLSLILHQLILIPLALYSGASFINLGSLKITSGLIMALIYLSLLYTIYEMARKTWSPDRENQNADSYTRFWGIQKALLVQIALTFFILFLMYRLPLDLSNTYTLGAWLLALTHLTALGMFKLRPTRKMSKIVEAAGSLFLLGMCALNAFAL